MSRHTNSPLDEGQQSAEEKAKVIPSTRPIPQYDLPNVVPNSPQILGHSYRFTTSAEAGPNDAKAYSVFSPALTFSRSSLHNRLPIHDTSGLIGLQNLGNTCYLSSALQALFHCKPLVALTLSHSWPQSNGIPNRSNNQTDHRVQLYRDFQDLLAHQWLGRRKSPKQIHSTISLINSYFQGYDQHDSQEVLHCILDALQEATQYGLHAPTVLAQYQSLQLPLGLSPVTIPSGLPSTGTTTGAETSGEEKNLPNITLSPIADIFGGKFVSEVTCSRCHNVTQRIEPFLNLPLELPQDDRMDKTQSERQVKSTPQVSLFKQLTTWIGITPRTITLEMCLHSFCTGDSLDQDNQFHCDKCKTKVDASRHTSIAYPPNVLCIQLKRFTAYGKKISDEIQCPLYDLNLSPFLHYEHPLSTDPRPRPTMNMQQPQPQVQANTGTAPTTSTSSSSSSKELISPIPLPTGPLYEPGIIANGTALYDLFAIIVHSGSLFSGHYMCYAKNHLNNKWYLFNDSTCTPVAEEDVQNITNGYIYFYQRKLNMEHQQKVTTLIQEGLAQVAQQKTSNHGMTKKPLYYIPLTWITRATNLAGIPPLSNIDLSCPHGMAYDGPLVPKDVESSLASSENSLTQCVTAYHRDQQFAHAYAPTATASEPLQRKNSASQSDVPQTNDVHQPYDGRAILLPYETVSQLVTLFGRIGPLFSNQPRLLVDAREMNGKHTGVSPTHQWRYPMSAAGFKQLLSCVLCNEREAARREWSDINTIHRAACRAHPTTGESAPVAIVTETWFQSWIQYATFAPSVQTQTPPRRPPQIDNASLFLSPSVCSKYQKNPQHRPTKNDYELCTMLLSSNMHDTSRDASTTAAGHDDSPITINTYPFRPYLTLQKDYRCISVEVFHKLVELYGGGPPIIRRSQNIYDDRLFPTGFDQNTGLLSVSKQPIQSLDRSLSNRSVMEDDI